MNIIFILCIIIAVVIAVTRVLLGVMEDRDRASGRMIDHNEYTMSGLLKMMAKDRIKAIRAWFAKRKTAKQQRESHGREEKEN